MTPSNTDSSNCDQTGLLLSDCRHAFTAGDTAQAKSICLRILERNPQHCDSLQLLSAIELRLNNLEKAKTAARSALRQCPDNAYYINSHALVLQAENRFSEALEEYDKALRLQPDLIEALTNKGVVLVELNRLEEAEACLDAALTIDSENVNAVVNKGFVLSKLGHVDDALELFECATHLAPASPEIIRNQLTLVNYSPKVTPKEIQNLTAAFWTLTPTKNIPSAQIFKRDPGHRKTRLRVGYVSGDFRTHTIGHLFEPVLHEHNRDEFHITLYSNSDVSDDVSQSLKAGCDDWRSIRSLQDRTVYDQIRKDDIDILVDLSGFTDGHRLDLFRLKPAPIQMTWLGYFSTTGLEEIDYIIADDTVLPPEDEKYYSETPLRLPHSYFCFQPPKNNPPLAQPPSTHRPYVTYGCLNNVIKLNGSVLATWSRILDAVPQSRLFLKASDVAPDYKKQKVMDQISDYGIDRDRVRLVGRTSREQHMMAYNEVDIALDPFPFGGGITSLETLWMGIPLVTLHGNRWVSRVAASVLKAAGIPETIAYSENEYIEIAKQLASDVPSLQSYRKNVRIIMASSPLCDAVRYTRSLERHYRDAWQTWCGS